MFSLWLKVLILLCSLCFAAASFEARIESIETLQGDEETLFEYNMKLVGRQRLFNGTIIHHVDLTDDYDIWTNFWTWKSGKWKIMNINMHQKPCHFMKTFYEKYFEPSLSNSNMPTGTDNKCPFRKGEYYVKMVELKVDNWEIFLNRGLTKARFSIKRNGKLYGGCTCVFYLAERGT